MSQETNEVSTELNQISMEANLLYMTESKLSIYIGHGRSIVRFTSLVKRLHILHE